MLELRLPGALAERPHHGPVIERARRWLVALIDGGVLTVEERAEAGDVLGRLGDRRPGVGVVEVGEVGVPAIDWLSVAGGTFTMGSPDDEELAWDWEKPEHRPELEEFRISRYPITNGQFRLFVDGDGYANADYWTVAGWAWRQGDDPDLSQYTELSEADRRWWAERLAARPVEKRDRPFFWDDAKWNGANRPVVGVTWYEAWAFGRWLEARYRRIGEVPGLAGGATSVWVRLPDEAQWEKAARGSDGRSWPWEGPFDAARCNTSEGGLQTTSAVGIFPGGASPCGAADMAGNVWEWTMTIWDTERFRYPYVAEDGRDEVSAADRRTG